MAWTHLLDKYAPRLSPSLLSLKKQFENSRLKSLVDDLDVWITELKEIHNQMDDIWLMSCMPDNDFMLHIMGNLPNKYLALLTDLENGLIAESGEKIINELMHWKLKAHFKRLQSNKEEIREEEKAHAEIKKQVEEKAYEAWNKWQYKGTYRNCHRYGRKAMNCPEKKSKDETNDANTSKKCHFSSKCFFWVKVGHRINKHHNKKRQRKIQKMTLLKKKTKKMSKSKSHFDCTS